MIVNSFFNYTFICRKWVSELRRLGTTVPALADERKNHLIISLSDWFSQNFCNDIKIEKLQMVTIKLLYIFMVNEKKWQVLLDTYL